MLSSQVDESERFDMLLEFNEDLNRNMHEGAEFMRERRAKFAHGEKIVCVPATGLVFASLRKMF